MELRTSVSVERNGSRQNDSLIGEIKSKAATRLLVARSAQRASAAVSRGQIVACTAVLTRSRVALVNGSLTQGSAISILANAGEPKHEINYIFLSGNGEKWPRTR